MTTSGLIFDVQRFALNDGPGIRTTVFLKGCPLNCQWCHNPESQSFAEQLSFNFSKCTNCLSCVEACPYGAHYVNNGVHKMNHDICKTCGKCVDSCLYNALKIFGKNADADSLMVEIKKDFQYYKASGGGLTISGGEPMSQFTFTKALLMAAKEKGIHTCLDTCGYAPTEYYEEILHYVDIFLFDYKATDDNKHKELTGVSNALILKNLNYLYSKGASIILRCPLIQGINDDIEHMRELANMYQRYPKLLKIDIMPYHNIGNDKYCQIGKKAPLEELKTVDDAIKKSWLETLKMLGCENVVLN